MKYINNQYDLTQLRQYVKESNIMAKFTPKQQEDLKAMAKAFDKGMTEAWNVNNCNASILLFEL